MANPESEFNEFISKVAGYHKAIEEEYEVAAKSDDTQEVRTLIDKKIATALPGFVDELIKIVTFSDSDNARLSGIKFAFNWYFKESSPENDPFTAMLNKLTKNDKAPVE